MLEMKNKYKTRVKIKEKQRVIKKSNKKRRKDNKTLNQKIKRCRKKDNKMKESKIKVLIYELLVFILSYLMLAP
jgi:hypothetical protein